MAKNEIIIRPDEEAVARAAATIREAGRQLVETFGRIQGLAAEPWRFYSPVHGYDVIAYVDDRNQVRHCKEDFVVPEGWRKLYIEKKAS